jgi:dipeptidyl aminopeptidase/acylaminoacyl peptidase
MTTPRLPSLFLLGALLGCGSHDSPGITETPLEVPDLEPVSFALLGPGKIAFERIGGGVGYEVVYIVDATAGRSTHSFDNTIAWGPALSPDGRLLAYASYNVATLYDVWVANVDGTGAQHVTNFPNQEGPPTWTADGARIVVVAGSSTTLVNNAFSQSPGPNPGNVTQITHFADPPAGGQFVCPTLIDVDQTVSSSSQGLLAFVCLSKEIDVLSPDGSPSASYVPSRDDRRHWPLVFSPKWSPDGTRLAFIETISDSATNYSLLAVTVKVMNADGTNVTTIASAPGSNAQAGGGWFGFNNFSLCWMPDGSTIVFNVPESALVGHLWVVRSDGSGFAQLTSAPAAWDRSVSCSRS